MSDPTTSVPPVEFTPTGLVLPAETAILAGAQADMNAAFGGALNPALNTPQGQLASSLSAIVAQANSVFGQLVDQVDPDNATGFMQDAIARIYFLNRNPALSTTVQLLCTGNLGVVIPVGAQAQDTSGNIYICQEAGTIGSLGNVTLPFANQVPGPIPCPMNTVTIIYQSIPGWDTVNNPTAGVEGANVESQQAFEFRRQQTVAANAHGSLPSIYGAVFEVPGVLDAYAYENVTNNNLLVGSTQYSLVPHSFYIGVTGGAAAAIAQAIWTKKNEGSNMNGNTTQIVTDTGYSFPPPTYTITFNIPTATSYDITVNIVNSSALPSTIVQDVQAAVAAQFNGTNSNGQRVRIGSLLLAASFYGPVATCEGPSVPVQVLSIFIGDTFAGLGTLVNGSNVLTITTWTSGKLSPGTVVSGTHIPTGTTIVQQLTGTPGQVGTYQMSANANATVGAPEAIAGTGGTAQQIGIDQQPVLGVVTVNLL
jgi:uncharacterized phage protein gp47/JayE